MLKKSKAFSLGFKSPVRNNESVAVKRPNPDQTEGQTASYDNRDTRAQVND